MIINKIALIFNDFVINLYSSGIKFHEILIGLFVFNFLVYVITYAINHFE